MARVGKDNSIELGPDGLEVLMAEMLAVIRSKERDPISLQLVRHIFTAPVALLTPGRLGNAPKKPNLSG